VIAFLLVTTLEPGIGAAAQIAPAPPKQHAPNVAAVVLAARAHLERGEHSAAYDLLRAALARHPTNVDVLYLLGVVSSALATREFDRLYTLAPEGARVHQLLAEAFKLQDKLAEAAAEYELALAVEPRLLEVLIELAAIRRQESDCERAAVLYRRAEAVRSTYEGTYGLGVCLAAQGDHKAAVQELRKALKHDPQSASAHFGLGSSLQQLDEAADAARALERAVALQPRMRQGHYLLGRVYRTLGFEQRSRQAFARAEELAQAERAADARKHQP
jgi:tetratricopeptide (TPR) repeat protein